MGRVSASELVEGKTGIEIHGKTLRIVFTYRGHRCRETLGLAPTKANIKHAVGLRAAVLHEIRMGTFDYSIRFPDSKNSLRFGGDNLRRAVRVGDLINTYIDIKDVDLGIQTKRVFLNAINCCGELLGMDRVISAIRPEDIDKFRVNLIATRETSTANHYMSIFRSFLTYCEKNTYTDQALSESCTRFKTTARDPDPLSYDEYRKIIDTGCNSESQKNLITLAVYTGMRTGEICALAWSDIDLEKGIINIKRTAAIGGKFKPPKTGRERTIKLMPPAIEALKSQSKIGRKVEFTVDKILTGSAIVAESLSPVFLSAIGSWYTTDTLRKKWKAVLKKARVRYRVQYQTRHTYATWNLTAHGNIAFIAKQLGHSDYSMLTKIYGRWMDDASETEAIKIWRELELIGHIAPKTPQD